MVCFLPVCKILDDRSSGNFRQVLLCGYAGGTWKRLLENRAYICRNNRSCLRKNCLILLMCVNRADGKIFVVTLQKLVLANELIRIVFMALVCIHGLFGAVKLAFQNVQKKLKQNLELIFFRCAQFAWNRFFLHDEPAVCLRILFFAVFDKSVCVIADCLGVYIRWYAHLYFSCMRWIHDRSGIVWKKSWTCI